MSKVVRVNDPGFLKLMEDYCSSGGHLFMSHTPKARYEALLSEEYRYAKIKNFSGYGHNDFSHTMLTIEEAREELGLDMKIDIENGKYIVSYDDPQTEELLNFLKEKYGTLYKNWACDWDNFQVNFKNPDYIGMGCGVSENNGQEVRASDILNAFKKKEVTLEEVYNFFKKVDPSLIKVSQVRNCVICYDHIGNPVASFYSDKVETGEYPKKQTLDNGTKVVYNDREYTFLSKYYNMNVLVREDDFVILATDNIEELEKQGVKEVKS